MLFANHFVLGRVLLEMSDKVELFTEDNLRDGFWCVWAPLAWPSIVGFEGQPALQTLAEYYDAAEIAEAWHESGLSTLTPLLTVRALGDPPTWEKGLYSPDDVITFMVAHGLLRQIRNQISEDAFELQEEQLVEAQGLRGISELYDPPGDLPEEQISELEHRFRSIECYLPPAQRRFAYLIVLSQLDRCGRGQSAAAQKAVGLAKEAGLDEELETYQEMRAPLVPAQRIGNDNYACPMCHLQLTLSTQRRLLSGELVPCSSSRDALIYYRPELPDTII